MEYPKDLELIHPRYQYAEILTRHLRYNRTTIYSHEDFLNTRVLEVA